MQGIIFDIDGTLWDSSEIIAQAYNHAVKKHMGYVKARITGADIKANLGKPTYEFIRGVFPSFTDQEQEFITPYFCEAILTALKKYPVPLFQGVLETFQALHETYDLFIVSNCQCGYIETLLKGTGLGPYVKDYLSNGDTGESKGTNIRLLMERNGLTDAVYVGDTQGDFNACRQANVPFIWAAYGFGQLPEAKAKIQRITDLIDYPF